MIEVDKQEIEKILLNSCNVIYNNNCLLHIRSNTLHCINCDRFITLDHLLDIIYYSYNISEELFILLRQKGILL